MTVSLEKLRAAFRNANATTNRGNFRRYGTDKLDVYPFWNIPVDSRAVVRFLPDKNEDNPFMFILPYDYHFLTVGDKSRLFPCLRNYDEDCPVCAVSNSYYKKGDEENGRKFWRRREYLTQAIIVKDPIEHEDEETVYEGTVCVLPLRSQIYKVINEEIESGDLESVPFDFEEGYDFFIKKTKQGKYDSYNVGSRFASKQRALSDDEIAVATSSMIELRELIPEMPDVEEMEKFVNAVIMGVPVDDEDEDENDEPVEVEDVVRPRKKKTEPVVDDEDDDEEVVNQSVDDEDDDDELDAEAILAKIRARRKKD